MSIPRIQYLSKKIVKNILSTFENRNEVDRVFIEMLKEFEEVRLAIVNNKFEIVIFDSIPSLFKKNGNDTYFPTLYVLNMLYNTKKILVVPTVVTDEGAISPLKRGADLMIPGIKKVYKEFRKGDIVAVMEPNEKYIVVVGIALIDSTTIIPGSKGKGIENISHIDDEIWHTSLQLIKILSK